MMAEGFPPVDIGQVNLDEWDSDPSQGISQRNAGMRVASRIDDDVAKLLLFSGMYPLNQGAFMIALEGFNNCAVTFAQPDQALVDFIQRFRAINMGFAGSEQVQIGPMQNKYRMAFRLAR